MPDEPPTPAPGEDDLVLRALLYTSGELDPEEAEAFEQRLGEDQAARDALCRAVELTQTLAPAALPGPDPSYRTQVRHRLRQRRRHRQGLTQSSGTYFSHPAFWSILGAAAAVLLMVVISQVIATLEEQAPQPPGIASTPGTNQAVNPASAVSPQMAGIWADLNNNDRLEKARIEELMRLLRETDRPHLRLVIGAEDREP